MRWAVVAAALAGLHVALFAAAVAGRPLLVLVALALAAVAERLLRTRATRVHDALESMNLGATLRLVVRSALVVLLAATVRDLPSWTAPASLAAMVLVLGCRSAALAARRTLRERTVWPLTWRGMAVPELDPAPERPVTARLRNAGALVVDAVELPVAAGILAVVAGGSAWWLPAATVATASVVVAVLWADRVRAAGLPARERDEVVAAVRSALEAIGPRVVVYFGGPPTSTHALNVWIPVLEGLDETVLVMVRQKVHLDQLASSRLPAVWAPKATDVEQLAVPSLGLALYPTNIAQNNHLIRVPGITDVFIGHGDSDKGGSFTPLSRMYDEVWVAGPAGRERYLVADVGVRDEQIREVGRPQLAEVARRASKTSDDSRPFTVLYAPTWEGFYAAWSYSSLLVMGERIVQSLLELEGVRVLVKPHPASGSVDKAYRGAARRVEDLVRRAGAPHRVVDGLTGLYEAFNDADLLVTDVSSVVTDFLWSRKPYVMTNPNGLADEDYRREFPSSAGAALWTADLANLAADVDDARGEDLRRSGREAVARHLLGNVDGDPRAGFSGAVLEVLAAAPAGPRALEPAVPARRSERLR
jgi:hypothetical protein